MVKGLFVGARVRILWSRGWPELRGLEGRIVAVSDELGISGNCEWVVAPDIWGTPWAPRISDYGAMRFAPNSRQLEPILPEGSQPLGYSFEQMMSEFGVTEAAK